MSVLAQLWEVPGTRGCSGAPWCCRSSGLGGGKLRQPGEEAGGHEDMSPAAHIS